MGYLQSQSVVTDVYDECEEEESRILGQQEFALVMAGKAQCLYISTNNIIRLMAICLAASLPLFTVLATIPL
jgi:hypothetical protein